MDFLESDMLGEPMLELMFDLLEITPDILGSTYNLYSDYNHKLYNLHVPEMSFMLPDECSMWSNIEDTSTFDYSMAINNDFNRGVFGFNADTILTRMQYEDGTSNGFIPNQGAKMKYISAVINRCTPVRQMLTGKGVNPQAADLDAIRPNYGVYWNFISAGFNMNMQSKNESWTGRGGVFASSNHI